MSKLCLYFHTVRHLRPGQVAARLSYRLRRPRLHSTDALPVRSYVGDFVAPVAMAPAMLAADMFRFLNVQRRCSTPEDWYAGHPDKLWTYNLHYFDDLNAAGSDDRRQWHQALMSRWVAEIPLGERDGWEPYPLSRRIVNWIKWSARGNQLSADLQRSLACQARWLVQRLEYHILGNHLFTNAKALLYAGLFFEGAEAERWLALGLEIVAEQIKEQVLSDGGHFELSTMYHAAMLEDVLDLINICRRYGVAVPVQWLEVVSKMRGWLDAMSHPDGQIAFFNDSAFLIAPTVQQLRQYVLRLGLADEAPSTEPVVALKSSGYARLRADDAHLFCDFAAVGPSYQPGHAHADTLSFEMSLGAARVFVNSGTSCYGTGRERQRQRGTAAHNTVVVDGQDSSEVWAGFRVARRAGATLRQISARLPLSIEASHDGYRRLPGGVEHFRRWSVEQGALRIEDRLTGRFETAAAYFHLHPGVRVDGQAADSISLSCSGYSKILIAFEGAQQVKIRDGTWHPEFGAALANRCIVASFGSSALCTKVTWIRPQ